MASCHSREHDEESISGSQHGPALESSQIGKERLIDEVSTALESVSIIDQSLKISEGKCVAKSFDFNQLE